MSLSLLLLLVCSAQASHFYGTVMTYYPKNTDTSGSITAVLRYKVNFHTCTNTSWACSSGDCGSQISLVQNTVDQESSGEWCQTEGIMTRQVPSNAQFQLQFSSGNWIDNIQSIFSWSAVTLVELRNRSDIGRANTSPQTTILPLLIVPSNCQRDFNLLAFDPDGDEVRCRYGNATQFECATCTPPSVLNLSSSCTLSFSPTLSSNEGAYVIQLVMEDFPRQTITLTQTNGAQTIITTNNSISKIPVQFALRVGPAVPSCTEGLYLPKFLPPTPANGAQLYTRVNQVLEINISVVANISTLELLFSGPYNVIQNTSVTGQYTLKWTPSGNEDGESHPICFVIQAVFNSVKYHSELRCVIVIVGNDPTTLSPTTIPLTTTTITTPTPQTTTTAPSTTTPLTPTNITTPTTTTTQTTSSAPSITTPLATTTIATPTTTTNIPPTTTPLTTTTITTPTPQTTTTAPSTTTPLTPTNITTPTTTTTQTTSSAPSITTPLATTTIATPTTTTNIPPTTTPLTTTTITTPTPQTTTTAPSTTTPLTPTNITTPTTTTTQTTSSAPSITTPLATTTIATPTTTTNIPPTTTPLTTTTITTPTPQTTTTAPSTTTPLTPTNITTPTTTTTQTTSSAPSITTPLATTTIATPTTTTNIPLTTIPLNTSTITTPTTTNTQTTTNISITTPLTTTTITTPPATTLETAPATSLTASLLTNATITAPNTTTNTTPQTTQTPQTTSPPPATTPKNTTAPNVSNQIVILRMKLSSPSPLSEEYIRSIVLQQIKDELVRQGLPSDTSARLVSSVQQ